MAQRSRTTFNKRQKEMARLEKQRAKAQRKAQRKLEGQTGSPFPDETGTGLESDSDSEVLPPPSIETPPAGQP